MPKPSANASTSCDGETGQALEAAAQLAAEDPSNKAALAELFYAMYEPIARYMNGRIQDPSTAEDLAQEVFVKVVQNIHTYTGAGIKGWIWAIARNVYNDYFRPMKNRGFEQPTGDFWHLDAPSTEMGPEESAEWAELRGAIRGKLDKLPKAQAMVLALRITCEFSAAETAEIMGRPVGTIRVLQCRALAKLRGLMPEGDSKLAMYLLSSSDTEREKGARATSVRLKEKDDVGSRG
ncbi:sigma-70 family RNA polymerase sigma factor [Streptomyces sp. BV286]|uniref:RNA polymerase sigma factor n=1 Tax=Streptomyces sp. BV286 TaxID=2849672 RepID=UPI001C2E354E|nr:sigma-70 family RNA polymerase sigma factor [Streptomyces sp. BV286]MBV1940793.1 sigma-70 family RNA polymerase sigma factor [Streptomyces sp. BV286]